MTIVTDDVWAARETLACGLSPAAALRAAYRRKWVTERKHLPDVDVTAAAGWKDTQSPKSAYQQADTGTIVYV